MTVAKMKRRKDQIDKSVARYLPQLDSADRQDPSSAIKARTTRLKEKVEKLKEERERLDKLEAAMLETEHPFGTIKARMGATHFLMKTLKRVRTEIALHVLAYNLTRVINILGVGPLMKAIRA